MSIRRFDVADAVSAPGEGPLGRWPSFASRRPRPAPRAAESGGGDATSTDETAFRAHGRVQRERLGIRLLRVVILLACYFILELVVKAVMVLQLLLVVWRKQPQKGLQRLGAMIAEYMKDMWSYCTFASDRAPWPFSPWPRGEIWRREESAGKKKRPPQE